MTEIAASAAVSPSSQVYAGGIPQVYAAFVSLMYLHWFTTYSVASPTCPVLYALSSLLSLSSLPFHSWYAALTLLSVTSSEVLIMSDSIVSSS
jgi:hypothetical protein